MRTVLAYCNVLSCVVLLSCVLYSAASWQKQWLTTDAKYLTERERARARARQRERQRQGETILITQLYRIIMWDCAVGDSSFTEILKLWALVRHMRVDDSYILVHMGFFCVHIGLFWVFWDLAPHNRALAHSHKQPHCVLQCVAVYCSVRNKVLLYALGRKYNDVYRCRVL